MLSNGPDPEFRPDPSVQSDAIAPAEIHGAQDDNGEESAARARTAANREKSETVSNILRRLVSHGDEDGNGGETISIRDLAHTLKDRAFGPCLSLFSLPGCVPGFPIMTSIFGPPMIFFGWQIAAGRHEPWLPGLIADKRIKRAALRAFIDVSERHIERFEKLCKPRWEQLLEDWAERLIGGLIVLFALCVLIPLPFTNMVPCLAISVIAMGFMQRDGLMVLVGIALGFVGIAMTYFILAGSLFLIARAF